MKSPVPIDRLEIVGYANVLLDSMLPSVVPPVFRLKGNPDEAFVPPYVFNAGYLCNATALSASELKALEQNQEITLFDGEPLAAQRDFELWLDQARHRHYEPRTQAHATLLALAKDHIQKAEQALKEGKTADAERFSGVALCADDRLVEPLAIKAALRRLRKDATGEGLMTKLAAPRMSEGGLPQTGGLLLFRPAAGPRRLCSSHPTSPRPLCRPPHVPHGGEASGLKAVMLKFPYIFTFYSFKGGVGRSLALLNAAYTLAGRGRHVLVVDMDLEAPGISSFLLGQKELAAPKTAHPLDVLALLSEAIAAVKAGGAPKDVASNLPPISNYIRSVADEKLAPLRPKMGQVGRLDVVVADRDHDYWRRWAEVGIQGLPQDQLIALSNVLRHYFKAQRFAHRPPGLEPFEAALPTPYDYVLVDSRTGITELGGLCVGPLADRLIVVTSLNDQNVQGTLSFMEEAGIVPKPRAKQGQPWDEADAQSTDEPELRSLGPKPTLVVASPVPSGEIDFKRARLEELKKRLGVQPIPLSYHPQMALLESVFVRDYPEEYLALEYRALTDRIMAQVSDHPAQLAQRSGMLWNEKKATADAIACVVRLAPTNRN